MGMKNEIKERVSRFGKRALLLLVASLQMACSTPPEVDQRDPAPEDVGWSEYVECVQSVPAQDVKRTCDEIGLTSVQSYNQYTGGTSTGPYAEEFYTGSYVGGTTGPGSSTSGRGIVLKGSGNLTAQDIAYREYLNSLKVRDLQPMIDHWQSAARGY